jgi:two-component system chemotaxis sensor kinase CheA
MLEMFVFETCQQIEQVEQEVLNSEKERKFSSAGINEIFRAMHTIKSSSAMMLFKNISSLAHATEDLFYFIRENNPSVVEQSKLTDILLECIDYMKNEMQQIQNGSTSDSDASELIAAVHACLAKLKAQNSPDAPAPDAGGEAVQPAQSSASVKGFYIAADKTAPPAACRYFKATIFFEDGCEMENVRAFTVVHHLKDLAEEIHHIPEDIIADESAADRIKAEGLTIYLATGSTQEDLHSFFSETSFLKDLELIELEDDSQFPGRRKIQIILDETAPMEKMEKMEKEQHAGSTHQSMISVHVNKLDMLMDIVGELVVAEAMVTQHPELAEFKLPGFQKAARQLQKISGELQDVVMSIRMVPLAPTFNKMNRIVRDACKNLQKEVELEIIGQDTEVDKNIIENISDPLMHLIRNAIDHGIEEPAKRIAAGKNATGKITLEAKNAGGDVWIIVKDDGRGLNREKILKKAKENGLTAKSDHELSDQEIYSFIFLPGFSTKEQVTELSGRGVGMDVVNRNIEKIGGTVQVDSKPGSGTTISVKIPLTLAIIDGMIIKVGNGRYTIPTIAIRQSFRVNAGEVITDQDENEMILLRGECYPILRLHKIYGIENAVTNMDEGITILVESGGIGFCLFADELLGQQQVVVKALPAYIKKVKGLAGCTLLGEGNISLILDVDSFIHSFLV